MKYNETIKSLIKKGLDEVTHSSTGHLSLSTRRAILQAINEPYIIGRISILCALKVYPIWNDFFRNDTKIIGLIEKRMYGFAKIEESSNLYKDLGFDSLMYVSLIVDIEKVFGIEIKLEELEECLSVKKLIEIAQAAWEKK